LAISFSSILKVGVGYDGKPCGCNFVYQNDLEIHSRLDICFETLTPPVLEGSQFHRTLTGDKEVDNRKYKQRVGSIHEGHRIVAPYAPHVRISLYNDPMQDVIAKFVEMCKVVGIADSKILIFRGQWQLDAVKKGFFKDKRLHILHKKFATFPFPIAFQLESLLHNGLLHTEDLEELEPRIGILRKTHAKRGELYVAELLRRYNEALQVRKPWESPMSCFDEAAKKFEYAGPGSAFRCCHVTFTPTRMLLEGPYATQSNRVIRRYPGYEDHFIRVDFRDEDRLQYRWDRAVDGTSFVRSRVGETLKDGFELAGRQFVFLAYSSSALREHAVWFMNPFDHPVEGWINGESIRSSLGDFEGTPLLKCPSKYAARLAQAFTATDNSVDIRKDEWEMMDDLVCPAPNDDYMFTDGVGTISRSLADRIWKVLQEAKHNPANLIQPSAVSLPFLHYYYRYSGFFSVSNQILGIQRCCRD